VQNQRKLVCRLTTNIPLKRRAAIGSVCVHWTMLEHEIAEIIWQFDGYGKKDGRNVTHRDATFMSRLRMMRSRAEAELKGKEARVCKQLGCDVENHYETRNLIVHGYYGRPKEAGHRRKLLVFTYRNDPVGGEGTLATAEYIESFANKIAALTRRLQKFRASLASRA
jgi:hypothetical protein